MSKVIKILFFLEEKVPLVGKPLLYLARLIKHHIYYKAYFFINRKRVKQADKFKIYWINPQKIEYLSKKEFDHIKDRGLIKGGDWDINCKKFEEANTYQGLKERFVGGKEWSDTVYYKEAVEKVKNGVIVWECRNIEQFSERLRKLDELFADIRDKGYRLSSQDREVNVYSYSVKRIKGYEKIDEILVNIGRQGQPLLNDGFHRLAMAKILGLEKVPVMILVRHKKWSEFKNELVAYAKTQVGKLYHQAYHFDLIDIPYIYGEERLNLIKNNISSGQGRVLDIGAYFGYFCHHLEELGFDCIAVEINRQRVRFMEKLREVSNDNFGIFQGSIFDYKKDQPLEFNVVLALNMFHHFLKTKREYGQLKAFLSRLNCQEMFFESHSPEEDQMEGAFKNYSPTEFVEFIKEYSGLKQHHLLKEFSGGRRLYKISKI